MFDIKIRPVLNGWVCKVGCAEVVFDSKSRMLAELGRYINDPQKVEKEYQDNAVNKNMVDRLPPEDRQAITRAEPGRAGTAS